MRRERMVPFVVFVACLVAAAPLVWGAGGRQRIQHRSPTGLTDEVDREPASTVTLCHYPPGNPANAHTIEVSEAAVLAHLAHGDSPGECPPPCAGGPPGPVPRTGQTACWDQAGNPIDCAGTGQDGEYQTGVFVSPRFADNADGTVKDNLTGLIWLKDASCLGIMDWSAALSAAKALASGSCGLTDGSVAGDWRLPNINELRSLIEYGQSLSALPPGHPFAGVQSFAYWSSTTHAFNRDYAWFVYFDDGSVFSSPKNSWDFHVVWPVRGGR